MTSKLKLPAGPAICYSGYRHGQNPGEKLYPSRNEIREDLLILQPHFRLLRLYDSSPHAERVLEVIRRDGLDFKIMLGSHLGAEMNNFGCPWGGTYTEEQLENSISENDAEIGRLIVLARQNEDIVFSVAVGNEATVDWTDHFVPVHRMIEHVRRVKQSVKQPVTFCENYVPWQYKLRDLVPELDFISVHTYPVWEFKHIHEAMDYTRENYESVARLYPDKPVIISEAGWATNSNGRGIQPHNTSQDLQNIYVRDLMQWSEKAGILTFVFEAFDEPWKGSPDPMEPEKHWGLYTVDRQPKRVIRELPAERMALNET
jgi:exo-beta-1,3-glucanase (GH17 family)